MKLSNWLSWAIEAEDESDYDIEIGLDSGLSDVALEIDRNQLIAFFKQKNLDDIFSHEELEKIAEETEMNLQEHIKEKVLMLTC